MLQPWHLSQEFRTQLAKLQALSGPFGSEEFVDLQTMRRLWQQVSSRRRTWRASKI